MKFWASLFGISVDGEDGKEGQNQSQGQNTSPGQSPGQNKNTFMSFRSPKEYENMSDDERKALTDKMMKQHKNQFEPGLHSHRKIKGRLSF